MDRYACAMADTDYNDDKVAALLHDLERVNRLDDPENKLRRIPEDKWEEEVRRPWRVDLT